MEKLQNVELMNVYGGAKLLWGIIGGLGILIVGIIDGFINPNKCNK